MLFLPVQQVLLCTSVLQSFTKVDITDQNRDGVNGVRNMACLRPTTKVTHIDNIQG